MIHTWDDLTADVDLSCDVCIVGTGAGGAVLAAGLAERGLDVVLLEEGGHYTRRDFGRLEEAWSFPHLYQERSGRTTADGAIAVLQGRSVGGSTTVNWTTCYRTPDRILAHWRRVHGLELDGGVLTPHFEAVEARLNVKDWPVEAANPNNRKLLDGCRALGWQVHGMQRNVWGCLDSGYCGFGCPVDAKQAMGVTYLQDALEAGARIFANTHAERFELQGGRVAAVRGRAMHIDRLVPDGVEVVIRPRVAVCSGGAINGPALLMRSGLSSGPVGRRTFIHPVVASIGQYAEPIRAWQGAPQSAASHEFIDRGAQMGFFLEAAPMHPMLVGAATRQLGAAHHELMADLPSYSTLIALSVDGLLPGDEGGTVRLRGDGRIALDYPIGPNLTEAFRAASVALARIHLAAGALQCGSPHVPAIQVQPGGDLGPLEQAPYGGHEHPIFTAHQMGGCAMGPDPETSVVDPTLRHHAVSNLYVVDGSVLPTALGVNPSVTIYGLAHWATDHVAAAAS